MTYQEKWVRGGVRARGDRECEARYDLVRKGVAGYSRAFSVLDIGANLGYFGIRLAEEYACVSVMVERRPDLADVARQNTLRGTVAIQRRLSVRDLQEIAKSEHFDVVLALNVVHHFKADWREAFDAILSIGDRVIIETPSLADTGACGQGSVPGILEAIARERPEVLGESPCHTTPGAKRTMFRIDLPPKDRLVAGYCYGERLRAPKIRSHVIHSTPDSKTFTDSIDGKRDWIHGMNLWNFVQLGGTYPGPDQVEAAVIRAARAKPDHGDVRPWNFIIGDGVHLIDEGHRQKHSGAVALRETLEWLRDPGGAYAWRNP